MKKSLLILALVAMATASFATVTTVFTEDFEGLEFGDIRTQGYASFVEANAPWFYCNVTNNDVCAGSKSLWCGKVQEVDGTAGSRRGGVWIPLTGIEDVVGQIGVLKVSVMVTMKSNMGAVGLGNGDTTTDAYAGVQQLYYFPNGGTAHLQGPDGKEIGKGFSHNGKWNETVIEILCPSGLILNFSQAGNVYKEAIGKTVDLSQVKCLWCGVAEPPYGANNRAGACIDNINVTFDNGPKVIMNVDNFLPASYNDELSSITGWAALIAPATKTVTFDVIAGDAWLKINGARTFATKMNPGELMPITLTSDESKCLGQFAKGAIGYSCVGFNGVKEFYTQGGTKGYGYCLFADDFEDSEDATILVRDFWVAAGTVTDCMTMEDPDNADNRCLKIGKAQALHTDVAMAADVSSMYDLKVSMKVKYPSASDKSNISFGTNIDPAEQRQGEYKIYHVEDGIKLSLDNCKEFSIDAVAPYDQWVDLSYSFNMAPSGKTLRYVTFNGTTYDVNKPIVLDAGQGTLDYFTQFRNYTWKEDANYYIDDLKIDFVKAGTVPEPAIMGLLALVALFLRRK